ncbi:hypothetical protein D3C87_418020 [compost metagenome]
MKKTLLSIAFVVAFTLVKAQNLTADNVVVLKLTSLSGYGRVATVSLEEYTTSGAVLSSTNISNTGTGNDFYLPYGSASNQATAYLNLSTDNQLLTLYGYNTLPSTTPATTELFAAGALNRTFVAINAAKMATKLTTDAHSGTNVNRSALAYPLGGGSYGIYLAGHGSGIKHATYNPTAGTLSSATVINSLNTIDVRISEGKLYATSQVTSGVSSFDTDLPTSVASIANTFTVNNSHDFVIFNLGANKVMYVAVAANTATAADGVFKYYSTDNGVTWIAAGKVDGNTVTAADNGFRGLSGRFEAGKITLYGVTSNNSVNSLLKIIDNTAYNVAISNANATITNLATAPTGSGFRGVAFTPGSTVTLPVTISQPLSAKVMGNQVNLSWATSSEQNSDRFEVLHSGNGKDFTKIGSRETKSPNGAKYGFTHLNVASGTNYYKLLQVDKNGSSEEFAPVVATVGLSKADFNIYPNQQSVILTIDSEKPVIQAQIKLIDITGRIVVKQKVNITTGVNSFSIPINLGKGIYVATVNGEYLKLSKKFIQN